MNLESPLIQALEWTVGYYYEDFSGKPNQIVENQYGISADAFDYIVGIIGYLVMTVACTALLIVMI